MIGIVIAIISGALMSIQGVFNTNFSKQTNLWFANCFVQITAFAMCSLIWLVTKSGGNFHMIRQMKDKYVLLGGIMGAFITFTVIKSMALLGPAKSAMIIVLAQIVIAYLIEVFGLFGVAKSDFELKKVFGVIVALAGILLFKS